MLKLDLQRFADGGAGAGGSGSTGAAAPGAADGTGASEGDAAPLIQQYRQKRFPGKKFDPQATDKASPAKAEKVAPEAQRPANAVEQEQAQPPKAEAPEDRQARFKALMDGEFKGEFDAWAQSTVKERLKASKEAEATLGKLKPVLDTLFSKYGLKDGDLDGLSAKVTDDDPRLEEEAMQKGIPVETLKEMKKLQRDSEEYKRVQQENVQRQMFEQHFQKLSQQAEEARQLYPGLDLRAELQNSPTFARLTHPSVGIDVRTAYEIAHRDELQPRMAAAVAQKTAQQLSSAVQSGSIRPNENGLKPSGGPAALSNDPRNWSRKEREEMVARAKRGERIAF